MTGEQAIHDLEVIKEDFIIKTRGACPACLDYAIEALRKHIATESQGQWIGNAFDEHHCNRCGHPALWEEEPDGYYEAQSRFCPNCGLPMKKGGAE